MTKVGLHDITIIFCLWPYLFYSDYTNTNETPTICVIYLTPGVFIPGSIDPQYLSLNMKRVYMNGGGKGC